MFIKKNGLIRLREEVVLNAGKISTFKCFFLYGFVIVLERDIKCVHLWVPGFGMVGPVWLSYFFLGFRRFRWCCGKRLDCSVFEKCVKQMLERSVIKCCFSVGYVEWCFCWNSDIRLGLSGGLLGVRFVFVLFFGKG